MTRERFREITRGFSNLRAVVLGDFCLDRYFDLQNPTGEISIETGLPVHNVARVRNQPGGAGTIVNNLSALGMGAIYPIGFAGMDGEGFELIKALRETPRVETELFLQSELRRTFTYLKPMLPDDGFATELNRFDLKNHSPTPEELSEELRQQIRGAITDADIVILLSQVDESQNGVLNPGMLEELHRLRNHFKDKTVIGDSRAGFEGWPKVHLKMNRDELGRMMDMELESLDETRSAAETLAKELDQTITVTLSEQGILHAAPGVEAVHQESFPIKGDFDVVGAGDSVTATLAASLQAGATVEEALALSMAAASTVLHQTGTTGTAKLGQMEDLLETLW